MKSNDCTGIFDGYSTPVERGVDVADATSKVGVCLRLVDSDSRDRPVDSAIRFVYVLRLKNGGWYVGSTRNLKKRIGEHLGAGGAKATRESNPIVIEKIYQFEDRYFGSEPARLRLEVFVASQYADHYGSDRVRGAKHGRGWDSGPTRNDLRFVRRARAFFQSAIGKEWLESVNEIDPRLDCAVG